MILSAERIANRAMPRPVSPVARLGLSYERRVFAELKKTLNPQNFIVERNPWFRYTDETGTERLCCPDILITDLDEVYRIVAEIKLSWVPNVLDKLRDLYCPVVQKAALLPTKPLVIARNSASGAPTANSRLGFALMANDPFLLWRDGPLII